jgi:hypothetical protein
MPDNHWYRGQRKAVNIKVQFTRLPTIRGIVGQQKLPAILNGKSGNPEKLRTESERRDQESHDALERLGSIRTQ